MATQAPTDTQITGPLRGYSIPVLETKRLILRAPRPDDADEIARLANDRRIAENATHIPHPYRLTDAEDFIAAANTESGKLAYVITFAGDVVGCCDLARVGDCVPELSCWIGAPFRGNGYATEAARGLIDHAFSNLGDETIQSCARVTNPVSRYVLEKCAFQWTGAGLLRIRALASSVPVDWFRLDRGIWASLKSWGQLKRRV
jgi:RimJ/RimL family protein N-acetyltransferase